MSNTESPWFRGGLQFECTRCGDCCAGAPGYVWVEVHEIDRLANYLGLETETFGQTYLRRVGDRLSLVETIGHACVFWNSRQGCTVYEARPDQCRTWPFWPGNLTSPDAWEGTKRVCPGAGQGPVIGLDEILASLAASRTGNS